MKTRWLVASFLLAVVLANLAVAEFGQIALVFTAWVLIPLDMLVRDVLHDRWRGTETTPDERRAEMTLDLYSELGQRQPHDNTTPPELSELVSAEERTDALYSRLREHLDNEGSTMSQQQVAEALKALDAALEDEAAALEPVLNRRLPSLERTRSVSEQADELIRKHGENPPRWLTLRMAGLIALGALIAVLSNPSAAEVVTASVVAFGLSMAANALVFEALARRGATRMVRMNVSNAVAAVVDSVAFPMLAFGVLTLELSAAQAGSKFLGGLFWSYLAVRLARRKHDGVA